MALISTDLRMNFWSTKPCEVLAISLEITSWIALLTLHGNISTANIDIDIEKACEYLSIFTFIQIKAENLWGRNKLASLEAMLVRNCPHLLADRGRV